jgi:hypothetical protein
LPLLLLLLLIVCLNSILTICSSCCCCCRFCLFQLLHLWCKLYHCCLQRIDLLLQTHAAILQAGATRLNDMLQWKADRAT